MTPPPSILAGMLNSPWLRQPWKRRLIVGALALVLALLSVWPRTYIARADLIPDDSGGDLSSLLGASGSGLLSLGALLGNHQSIEADLTIARSQAVIVDVVKRLDLVGRHGFGNELRAEVKLRKKADIESIRGSILQITVRDRDPSFALELVRGFVTSVRGRMTILNLDRAAQKKAVATNRIGEASIALARAQDALNRFRAANKLAVPEIQLGAAVTLITQLQAKLDGAEAALRTLRTFATDQNVQVQAVEAEISSLRDQIAASQSNVRESSGPTLGIMSPKISEYQNLYRDERYADTVYEIYRRYLETVTVDELSATTNLNVVEPPFVDPARQYNIPAVGALFLVLLFGAVAEFYVLRPPPGRV